MKKQLVYSMATLFMVVIVCVSGCKKDDPESPESPEPLVATVANFTFTGAGVIAPSEVSFTNTSTNATSYAWDFGDGVGATSVKSPKHTYTSGGTFTVKLTSTGAGGSDTITKTVDLLDPLGPVANFTYSGAGGFAPCVVSFTNTSTNATSYIWDFGDGGGTSSVRSPQHMYTSGGTFTVHLTSTGAGGSHMVTKTINISDPVGPVANFTFSGAGGLAPCVVSFTNTSTEASYYSWDFGDGSSIISTMSPSHTFNSGGIFSVTLTATSANGTSSITKNVNIESPPTSIEISQLKLTDYPQTDNGAGWDFSNGPDIYWVIKNEAMTTTYFTSGTINDAIHDNLPFTYSNGLPYSISDINKTYVIFFYDADSPDADDAMGGYYFKPGEYTNYSSTLYFYSTTSDFGFDLSVDWSNRNKSFKTNNTKTRIELIPIRK